MGEGEVNSGCVNGEEKCGKIQKTVGIMLEVAFMTILHFAVYISSMHNDSHRFAVEYMIPVFESFAKLNSNQQEGIKECLQYWLHHSLFLHM